VATAVPITSTSQLLYSDTVTPPRLSLAGGVTALSGIGFSQGLQVSVAGNLGTLLSAQASQMQVALPSAAQDGTATIQVTDPVTGSFSQMTGALTYGAAATDLLLLLQGADHRRQSDRRRNRFAFAP